MIILFQNLLTGLIFYFLGNPLMANLIPVILDEQGSVIAIFPTQIPSSLHCGPLPLQNQQGGERGTPFLFLVSSTYNPQVPHNSQVGS